MVHTTPSTLHLHYDLERPGYQGYDRRHFPERHRLTLTEPVYKPRGRAHIPSPPLQEVQWRPHGQYMEPAYSNIGPDWKSSIRFIEAPSHPNDKPTLPVAVIERNIHFMRPFPQNWQQTTNDWIYFPDNSPLQRSSKRNHFADIHLRSIEDLGDENVSLAQIGRKRRVYNFRNGLEKRSEGDKSYRNVEYSPDFHKLGSTLPPINFGREKKHQQNQKMIVPMTNDRISVISDDDFEKKEELSQSQEMVEEVIQLENWKASENLTSAFQVLDRQSNGKYRSRLR